MDNKSDKEYNKKISERVVQILDYAGLEIKGIAAMTGKSIDIFYAVISGRRSLSNDLAKIIGDSLDFDGNIIFNLNTTIPTSIKNSNSLSQFRQDNINNKEFFLDTWSKDKDSNFIKRKLIYSEYFSEPRYAWEVNERLVELGRDLDSDLLSKQLKYFVRKGIIKSKRSPIKLKGGGYGKREVDVYYI